MKIIYFIVLINILVQFIRNVRNDKKVFEIVASVLAFIMKIYFMVNVYRYIFK